MPSAQSPACFLDTCDAFAETNKTTGIAPLMSTVHAAVGTVIEHRRMVGLPHTLEASKPHGVEHGGC